MEGGKKKRAFEALIALLNFKEEVLALHTPRELITSLFSKEEGNCWEYAGILGERGKTFFVPFAYRGRGVAWEGKKREKKEGTCLLPSFAAGGSE